MMTMKRIKQLERTFPTVSSEKSILKCKHPILTTKISLHVDKDSRNKKENQLLCDKI